MSRHRLNAWTLRVIADGIRQTYPLAAADLEQIAADVTHHRLIVVPIVRPIENGPTYMLVHANANDTWQSLSYHHSMQDAVAEKKKMRRHWRNLRKSGADV